MASPQLDGGDMLGASVDDQCHRFRRLAMFNARLACPATVFAVVTLSCGGGHSPGSFASSPTTPRPVTALSERAVADESISRPGRELGDINTATAVSLTLSGMVT